MARIRQYLFPAGLPTLLSWAILAYLAHILCQGWVATSEFFALAAICCVGFAVRERMIPASAHILYLPLVLYGVASTISSAIASRNIHWIGEIGLWVKMLLFPAALMLFREVPWTRILALRAHIVFALSATAGGLFQYFVSNQRDLDHRITGPASHVMTLSGLLMPLSLLMVVLAVHERKRWQFVAAGLITVALLLTFTRSVWLGWFVAVVVLMVISKPRWIVLAAPALVLFVTFMPMSLFGRLLSTFDMKQASNFDRIRMIQGGTEMIRDYPAFGVGPGNVKQVYPLYRRHDAPRFRIPHLHNNFVQIWAERGLLALMGYVLLLALFLRSCARGWRGPQRRYAEVGLVVCLALTFAGLFEFNFGDTEVFFLMLDLFALVVATIEPPLKDPSWPMVPAAPSLWRLLVGRSNEALVAAV